MSIALFTIGFGRPDLLYHQKRLLDKYLDDDFGLCCIDNTPGIMRNKMEKVCKDNGIGYLHTPDGKTEHNDGLNYAALHVTEVSQDYVGFLDMDIFPRKHTTLIDKIQKAGFYGVAQTHWPTGARYLWPGFCFFSREWINGRELNFDGIRGKDKRHDGDCGSMMHTLFSPSDWENHPLLGMGYRHIRGPLPGEDNIQSWGYEIIGDWLHFMNSSHWMKVTMPEERDQLLLSMIECL